MTNLEIAKVCHEANRAICEAAGDMSQKPWDQAEQWQKASALAGVVFAKMNPNATPGAQHVAWCNDKVANGWKYGPVKDVAKKEHPCLVDFIRLPVHDQIKDHVFRAIVNALK